MQIPKANKIPSSGSGFGLGNILGLIFLLIGILLVLSLTNLGPVDLSGFSTILQYGAALGSILGGIAMLFKKKETIPNVK
jgi:uncharacterized membrane protein YesL